MEDSNPELESFRQQWRAEVSARTNRDDLKALTKPKTTQSSRPPKSSSERPIIEDDDESDEEDEAQKMDKASTAASQHQRRNLSIDDDIQGFSSSGEIKDPESALEHYEKAVEKEAQGSLGDSLNLYRKAFRMDSYVDVKYKQKHFPPSFKPSNTNPSNAAKSVPNTAHHSLKGPPQTFTELISGFSGLSIEPAAPEIEGTPASPCPISTLPEEILIHILTELAVLDVSAFVRMAQVCKRLAYLVTTEEQIWRRVCLGSEVGFLAMHYAWQTEIQGRPLKDEIPLEIPYATTPSIFPSSNPSHSKILTSLSLLQSTYASSWQRMFRFRPRIRFNGCYISTVNYIRPGQASPTQISWNSPVHIVTYYRYLRFFRDGTVLSLLTTNEPSEVVHYLTKEHYHATHKGSPAAAGTTSASTGLGSGTLPNAVMANALRGRWHLSSPDDTTASDSNGAVNAKNTTTTSQKHHQSHNSEGDLYIETEGVGAKYVYRMELTLRNAGSGTGKGGYAAVAARSNNKLVWKGFWNYNKLTDDWGEFGLRNDKAFFWSRVKSYGMGA